MRIWVELKRISKKLGEEDLDGKQTNKGAKRAMNLTIKKQAVRCPWCDQDSVTVLLISDQRIVKSIKPRCRCYYGSWRRSTDAIPDRYGEFEINQAQAEQILKRECSGPDPKSDETDSRGVEREGDENNLALRACGY